MSSRPFPERAVTSVLAVLVLAAFVALLIFVPHQLLLPLSVGFVAFAVLTVFGTRAYLRRLETVAELLDSDRTADATPLLALLSEPERRLLWLPSRGTAAEMSHVLRRRQSALAAVAMSIAIPGICAFMVVVYFLSD